MICDQDSTCACAPMFKYRDVVPTTGYFAGRSTTNLKCVPGKASKRIAFNLQKYILRLHVIKDKLSTSIRQKYIIHLYIYKLLQPKMFPKVKVAMIF